MRIVFIGTVEFSLHCLKEIFDHGGHVVAVLTSPREKARFNSDYADLQTLSNSKNVPTYFIHRWHDPQTVSIIRSLKPDVIFVFGISHIIPKEIMEIPPLGCVGVHPALLPANRGRHPLIWALVKGLKKSGLTFFFIDEGVDSGDILWQKSFAITLNDDARSLYDKIKALASEAIQDFLPKLASGDAPRTPQDHSKANYLRKRTEKDGEIDWAAPATQTYNLIRALTHPYVGAHTYFESAKTILWQSRLPNSEMSSDALKLDPGTVFDKNDKGLSIRTGDGYLYVPENEIQIHNTIPIGTRLGRKA